MRTMRTCLAIAIVCSLSVQCQKNRPSAEKTKTIESIQWSADLAAGFQKAKRENKILMIEFTAEWCPYCRMMEDSVFTRPDVIQKAGQFVPVRIDVDKQPGIANQYQANARKYGGSGIPNVLFLNREGEKLMHAIGYFNDREFLAKMDSVLIISHT
jgi:thiol:disulfide interchange protein